MTRMAITKVVRRTSFSYGRYECGGESYRPGGREGISGLPVGTACLVVVADEAGEFARVTTCAPSASDGDNSSVNVASLAPTCTGVAVSLPAFEIHTVGDLPAGAVAPRVASRSVLGLKRSA